MVAGKDECQIVVINAALREGHKLRLLCSANPFPGKHIRRRSQDRQCLPPTKDFPKKKQDGNQQEYQENTYDQRVNALDFSSSPHCKSPSFSRSACLHDHVRSAVSGNREKMLFFLSPAGLR